MLGTIHVTIYVKDGKDEAWRQWGCILRLSGPEAKPESVSAATDKEPALSRIPTSSNHVPPDAEPGLSLLSCILTSLDNDKVEDLVTIDLAGRSSLCDALVIGSGRSQRHVAATAVLLARRLKEAGFGTARVEGIPQGDWALIDAGDVIVHLFRPEVRSYYDLEGMWSVEEDKSPRMRSSTPATG